MTNADGLGTGTHMSAYMSWQNAEHSRHRPNYGDVEIPHSIRDHLPGSLVPYNTWLEEALQRTGVPSAKRVLTFMGFIMGFRKDYPLHEPAANRFIHAGRNAHQEYAMFQVNGTLLLASTVLLSLRVLHAQSGLHVRLEWHQAYEHRMNSVAQYRRSYNTLPV